MNALDEDNVAKLASMMTVIVTDHIDPEQQRGRNGVYEVLNALAIVSATALAATGKDLEASREWFDHAVTTAIIELQRDIIPLTKKKR
jgi:hypothetical protein